MMNLCINIIGILSLTSFFGEAPANNIIAKYNPSELLSKIFSNNTLPRGFVQFENEHLRPDLDSFEGFNQQFTNNVYRKPVIFNDDSKNYNEESENKLQVKFQDITVKDGKIKRRKKKPRQHYGLSYPSGPTQNYVPGPYLNPAFGGQYYRPPSPSPSIASEALSRITEALTSIALNDDQQCVARLLCEAAGGGALGSSGVLQTVSGLGPLLTLLSAYNGLSTNPLFVFGRAVFLGMSAKGNTASCRYGYPLCPTDLEQLVHYLNNHNGGFFRFFNAPQQGQQNVEQLYNHLSQNYGLYQQQQQQQQNYGFYNPNPGFQNSGSHQNIYSNNNQNYGIAFSYNGANKIQKRIQNKPLSQYIDDYEDENPKWKFPDDNQVNFVNDNTMNDNINTNTASDSVTYIKKGKGLKFPEYNNVEYNVDNNRNNKGFSFPESQSNRQYNYNNYPNTVTDYGFNNYYNRIPNHNYVYDNNNEQNNDSDDIRNGIHTVYVVRGNGDPNKPEIIKLRPGETVH